MANNRYLAYIAWHVAEQVVAEWQQNPYAWDREVDIQSEIASRLVTAYRLIGYAHVVGNYPDPLKGYPKQNHSRVSCGPQVRYRYKDGKRYTCYPDIVVWADLEDPDKPPHWTVWPILWACELKYGGSQPRSWDIEKLRYLIAQGTVQYGCFISLKRRSSRDGKCLVWRRDGKRRLWYCSASLPGENRVSSIIDTVA